MMVVRMFWWDLKAGPYRHQLFDLPCGWETARGSPPTPRGPGLQALRLLRPPELASGQSSLPPALSQAALPLPAPLQRRGTVQDYTLFQQVILFPDGLGPKPCHFAAVSAYGSCASRTPGDTAGSAGEASELLASRAMSLR